VKSYDGERAWLIVSWLSGRLPNTFSDMISKHNLETYGMWKYYFPVRLVWVNLISKWSKTPF